MKMVANWAADQLLSVPELSILHLYLSMISLQTTKRTLFLNTSKLEMFCLWSENRDLDLISRRPQEIQTFCVSTGCADLIENSSPDMIRVFRSVQLYYLNWRPCLEGGS